MKSWLDKLISALICGDEKTAFFLVENIPQDIATSSLEYKLQALELISQTRKLLESKQLETRIYMEQIEAAKKFLENSY